MCVCVHTYIIFETPFFGRYIVALNNKMTLWGHILFGWVWRHTHSYPCVCVCVFVCMCVRACISVCVCVYVYIHTYIHTYINTLTRVLVWHIHVYVLLHASALRHTQRMCKYYIYIYIYIYRHTFVRMFSQHKRLFFFN